MTDTPLRELLTDLTRDPAAQAQFEADPGGWLASHGHDLPSDLVAEAVSSVSAVLPVDVAEHLAPFTIASSPIPSIDDTTVDDLDGLSLLRSAPAVTADDAGTGPVDDPRVDGGEQFGAGASAGVDDPGGSAADPIDGFDDPDASVTGVDIGDATSDVLDPLDPAVDAGTGIEVDTDTIDAIDTIGDDPADLDGLD